jgi:hypothetical protein
MSKELLKAAHEKEVLQDKYIRNLRDQRELESRLEVSKRVGKTIADSLNKADERVKALMAEPPQN